MMRRIPLLLAGLLMPAALSGQASLLSPVGSDPGSLSSTDDGSIEVSLTSVFPSGVKFGNTTYTTLHVGTNGYITFGHGSSVYDPEGIAGYTNGPIVAAQFDDLDPSKGGTVSYVQDGGAGYVMATWQDIQPFSTPVGSGSASTGNTFQILLRTTGRAATDFDLEIRYVTLNWAASGNVTPAWPTAGWSAGDGLVYSELPESGTSSFQSLLSGSNVGQTGIYRWEVTDGIVQSTATVTATAAATGIGTTAATSGGTVSNDGGHPVTARGVAYGTTSHPTVSGSTAVASGGGTGTFSVSLEGLTPATTYYLRAYATNALGTAYGPQQTFTTLAIVPPSVTTSAASAVDSWNGSASGNVTADGSAAVTARGVAYGTSANPTIAGSTVAAGSGTGAFSVDLTGLDPATTYYVRAYATNQAGTGYGEQLSFSTPKIPQTITFAALAERQYGEAPFQLTATANSGLSVSYASSDTSVVRVSGDSLVIRGVGTAEITASQPGTELYAVAPDVVQEIRVLPRTVRGVFTVESVKIYDGTTDANVLSRGLVGVLPADSGLVTLSGGTAAYETPTVGLDKTVYLQGATLTGTRSAHYSLMEVTPTKAAIHAGPPAALTLEGAGEVVAGQPATLTLSVRDAFGNPTPVQTNTKVRLSTDQDPLSATFAPGEELTLLTGATAASFTYASSSVGSGLHHITARAVAGGGLPDGAEATHDVSVVPGTVRTFRIESAAGGPVGAQLVGVPFQVRIVAVDAEGNVVSDFQSPVTVGSNGVLSQGAGETVAFQDGVLSAHAVEFATPGAATLTASAGESSGSIGLQVSMPTPALVVSIQASDDTPALGQEITLEVSVVNEGTQAAHDVVVENPLSGQTRLAAVAVTPGQGTVEGDIGPWRVGTLEPGARATLVIRARVIVP